MQQASLIVIRAGTSAGLLWEIEQCIALQCPQKLILLIPFHSSDYLRFVNRAARIFPKGLPNWKGDDLRKVNQLDLKAIVYFDTNWDGALAELKPSRRLVLHSLEKSLAKAIYPIYEKLAISPKTTSTWLRTDKDAVLFSVITACLVTGVFFAYKLSLFSAIKPLTERIYTLHFFSKSRIEEIVDVLPGTFGLALEAEIERSDVVRKWFESAPNSELEQIRSRVVSGMARLSDELLYEQSKILGSVLNGIDSKNCATVLWYMTHGVSGSYNHNETDLLKLIEMHAGKAGIMKWANITVKALEADLTKARVNHLTEGEEINALKEMQDLLPNSNKEKMIADLQQYSSLPDDELCWVERTLNQTQSQLSPASRSAFLRAGFGVR